MSIVSIERTQEAIAKAQEEGFEIVRADDFTLLCDLDGTAAVTMFNSQLNLLQELSANQVVINSVERYISKSGNTHAIVRLGIPLDAPTRIACQMAIGSDLRREMLSLVGVKMGIEDSIVLFKPPGVTVTTVREMHWARGKEHV